MLPLEQSTTGALYLGANRCSFRVWAPHSRRVHVRLLGDEERVIRLNSLPDGYFEQTIDAVPPGQRYFYRLDNRLERPDPGSRFQPDGVHGPSAVVDPSFDWTDASWQGRPLSEYILYELHVGAFSPQGTFDGVIDRLDELVELGITAIELMPVAANPGQRNWGYDGVYLFAVQNHYGGPAGLKRLVDACHRRGLAVVLDVVYNHLGPEGNYLGDFGPYFSSKHRTPWGEALNFDGPESREVRRFFLANALRWIDEFHIDALRLDAVHAIFDSSAEHFLKELAIAIHLRASHLGRPAFVIAESNFNIPRLTEPRDCGGDGLDAQWNDDFHYALHARLTGERASHYRDFGGLDAVAKTLREGFVLTGQFSHYRGRPHGQSSEKTPADRLIICLQNHDQVGNRPRGERLGQLLDFETRKLAASLLLLSPYIPLLFMGEEYDDDAPFLYFVDHSDPRLVDGVRRGRESYFANCRWRQTGLDPGHPETFARCRLNRDLRTRGQHAALWNLYRRLIEQRKQRPSLQRLDKRFMALTTHDGQSLIQMHRWQGEAPSRDETIAFFNLGEATHDLQPRLPPGAWTCALHTSSEEFAGPLNLTDQSSLPACPIDRTLPRRAAALYYRAGV